jgi:putative copper export protein
VSQVIVRQVADVLTMVAVGAVAVAVAVASRSGQTVAVVSAALGAGFTVALALLAADEVGDLGEWAGPAHGWAVFARAAALLIVAATAYRWRAPAALAAALALASYAVVGHVRGLGKWWLDGPLLAVHLFAAALWLGAAPAMLLHLRDGRIDDESARRAARRFSLSATVALPVVVLAGAMLGLRATDLRWSAGYTGLLIAKTVVVLAAAGLGTLARRRLRAEGSRRHLVGVFAVDSALLLAATVLAATISTTRPPVHASSEHQHPNASGDAAFIEVGGCNADVSGLAVRVTLSPGRVGANAVRLAIGWASADTPGTMTLLLTSNTIGSGALDVGLTRSSELLWEGAATFPVAGDWTVAVEHRPDEFTVRRGECALRVV